jgi:MFS family permease
MTRVDARQDDRGPESGNGAAVAGVSTSRSGYLAVLREPGALAFSSTGFVARMSMAMYGIGTVLLIALLTGRYGTAGTVAAIGSIAYAVGSPYVARLTDRFGQRPVLLAQVAIFFVTCTAFIASAELRAPFVVLLATGAAAGASMPSTGSMVRIRWSALFASDDQKLHVAFALESVNDEFIFVVGPVLVTLLATQVFAAAGIGTASLLAITGTLLFALQRRTEPALRPRPTGAGGPGHRPRARLPIRSLRLPSVPAVGLVTLSPAFLMLGAMFSTIELSTVAFASELGHRPLAGLILGTYALGSAIGGLWYGSRHWNAPLGRRFVVTTIIVTAGVATFWAMPGLLALDATMLLAGMAIAPTLIAGYAILERQAPPHRSTEALAWLSSTISLGVAVGSAVAGHLVDAYGARAGFGFAACCGGLAAAICLAGRRKLETAPPGTGRGEPEELGVRT